MNNTYDLVVNLNPAEICTAQQKGARVIGGRVMFYTKPEVEESNRLIRNAIEQSLRDSGVRFRMEQVKVGKGDRAKYKLKKVVADTIEKGVPVEVCVTFCFPFHANASRKRLANGQEYMTERPDLDNITKSVLDELTDLKVWNDDGQVVDLHIRKFRHTSPSIHLGITCKPPLDKCPF